MGEKILKRWGGAVVVAGTRPNQDFKAKMFHWMDEETFPVEST